MDILNNPYLNKGTGFTLDERQKLGLVGALPAKVQTLQEQADETYAQFKTKPKGLPQRQFLMEIFNTNRTLFFYLMSNLCQLFMIR